MCEYAISKRNLALLSDLEKSDLPTLLFWPRFRKQQFLGLITPVSGKTQIRQHYTLSVHRRGF